MCDRLPVCAMCCQAGLTGSCSHLPSLAKGHEIYNTNSFLLESAAVMTSPDRVVRGLYNAIDRGTSFPAALVKTGLAECPADRARDRLEARQP